MSVAMVAVGATAVSGIMGANAAKKGAQAQAQSAADATALQKEQFDKQVELQEPFRRTGVAANSRLAYLLGLTPDAPGGGGAAAVDRNAIRERLLPQYTTTTAPALPHWSGGDESAQSQQWWNLPTSSVNEAELNAAIDREVAQMTAAQQAASAAQQQSAMNDPAFGSLMRNFTKADMEADPVYQSGLQFGLDEGRKGVNRIAAAGGGQLSGATLKALTRFGNDYGSTKANESFNRFNTNQDRAYNKLAGVSGAGQQATNQVGAASANFANNASNNIIGAGNARAAGYIGGANAIGNAVGQGVGAWQGNSLMNRLFPSGGSTPSFGTGPAFGNQDIGQFL